MADMPMAESVVDCVRDNPRVMEAWHLRACGIQEAWQYQAQNDLPVAGAGTIVAVIDTGVDYTHKELSASMWRNVNEIPDNNIDDDGNGYTDDYYGVDVITGKGSGNDDHGHGTHVAGIIAAANNREGTVGVAYNAKIMNVKAGQSSGYFLQSDVAKAIVYAYENGADVINMSFGGTSSSMAVQDALATAYTRCVLVAAAGNDSAPNERIGMILPIPNYPAAFPYVLGVMSIDPNGVESVFTNADAAEFNSVEYEVYAPGGQILSTIPGDRYAAWSGTSMASPVAASIAAMLRADLPDRASYPTKYIYGQIAGTGVYFPGCSHSFGHNIPSLCDAFLALTVMPHPELGVSDYLVYDTEGFAEKNNGDGVIDAGETVALGFTLRNRWGMSKDTMVTVDALSSTGIPCPYVTFSTDASDPGGDSAVVNYGSIGTYSEGDCGKLYNGVTPNTINSMKEMLTVADLCYPNFTEACYLTDTGYHAGGVDKAEARRLIDGLRKIGSKSVLITSIPVDGQPSVVGYNALDDKYFRLCYNEIPVHFPGTGDIFSAILIGHLLNGEKLREATRKAMDGVYTLIDLNKDNEDKNRGIPLEQYLYVLRP